MINSFMSLQEKLIIISQKIQMYSIHISYLILDAHSKAMLCHIRYYIAIQCAQNKSGGSNSLKPKHLTRCHFCSFMRKNSKNRNMRFTSHKKIELWILWGLWRRVDELQENMLYLNTISLIHGLNMTASI